jgi:ribonuclease HI
MITIYTDGASRGNPGPGGYGIIMISGSHSKELSEGFRLTTNNRMELLSVIVALESLRQKGQHVTVYSDSKYVVDAIEQRWIEGWIRKGFKKVKNPDLWSRFLKLYKEHHVKFKWVKGHNNHPLNERCDELAVAASFNKNLKVDEGYEAQKKSLFG